jgi:hypothetical protein
MPCAPSGNNRNRRRRRKKKKEEEEDFMIASRYYLKHLKKIYNTFIHKRHGNYVTKKQMHG